MRSSGRPMTPPARPTAGDHPFIEELRGAKPRDMQLFAESAYPDLAPAAALARYLQDVERASRHGPSEFFDTACEEMPSWPKKSRS